MTTSKSCFRSNACKPITLNGKMGSVSKGLIGLEWLLFKTGLGATNHFESCGFIRTRAGVEYPDLQYHFLPAAIRYDGKAPAARPWLPGACRPQSARSRAAGSSCASADPKEPPRALFNYMSHPDDWADFRSGIRLTREILEPAGARALSSGEELSPGEQVQSR